MTDKNTDKAPAKAKPASASGAVKSSPEASDKAQVKTPAKKKAAKKPEVKKTETKKTESKKPVVKKTAAELDKANNAIRSKKSVDDLKARAAEAKKRAQQKILDKSFVSDPPVDPLERLADTFDHSARRWEMVVYPSLFAFVLLAGYGFFLIYRLTHDISTLSHSVTRMAVIVSEAMPRMTKDLGSMTGSMDNMTENISGMSGDVKGMTTEISSMSNQMDTLTPLSQNISNMTGTMNEMNRSVYGMQRDMGGMNRTISSGPFGMMNDFMPFSSNTNVAPPLPPPTYRQPWEVRRSPAAAKPVRVAPVPAAKSKAKQVATEPKAHASPAHVKTAPDKTVIKNGGNSNKKAISQKPVMHGSGINDNRVVASVEKR